MNITGHTLITATLLLKCFLSCIIISFNNNNNHPQLRLFNQHLDPELLGCQLHCVLLSDGLLLIVCPIQLNPTSCLHSEQEQDKNRELHSGNIDIIESSTSVDLLDIKDNHVVTQSKEDERAKGDE